MTLYCDLFIRPCIWDGWSKESNNDLFLCSLLMLALIFRCVDPQMMIEVFLLIRFLLRCLGVCIDLTDPTRFIDHMNDGFVLMAKRVFSRKIVF